MVQRGRYVSDRSLRAVASTARRVPLCAVRGWGCPKRLAVLLRGAALLAGSRGCVGWLLRVARARLALYGRLGLCCSMALPRTRTPARAGLGKIGVLRAGVESWEG